VHKKFFYPGPPPFLKKIKNRADETEWTIYLIVYHKPRLLPAAFVILSSHVSSDGILGSYESNSTPKMETKFSHEGSKAQRTHEELRNYQASNLFMNFFVPSCLRGIFGSGLSGLDIKAQTDPAVI
jgi:hypothetical protein